MTEAKLTLHHSIGYEDHLTGAWMLSLPPHPHWNNVDPQDVPARRGVSDFTNMAPPSPEPLTGLYRSETYGRSVSWFWWWVPKDQTTITVHGMKGAAEYKEAWQFFENLWLAPTWIGQRATTPYEWIPPSHMVELAERGRPMTLNVTTYWEKHHSRRNE